MIVLTSKHCIGMTDFSDRWYLFQVKHAYPESCLKMVSRMFGGL